MAVRQINSVRECQGPINRRTWLQVGGLSLGTLITAANPTLRTLATASDAQGVNRDFSVILFWANGGPSHIDLFDLKPDAPSEYRGPFRPIPTAIPGLEINELLPELAKRAKSFTLIRSLQHERNEHSGGTHRFLTGYSSRQANLNHSENPEIGAVVRKQLSSGPPGVPLFVANTKFYGGGPAYLGPANAPYMPAPNPQSSTGNNTYDPIPIYPQANSAGTLTISSDGVIAVNRRSALLQELDAIPRWADRQPDAAALNEFQRQAVALLSSSRARQAFDLTQEDSATRDRYGHTHWGKSLLTCRRLVEAGVRFVQVQAEFRLPEEVGRTSNWDDHSVNSNIFRAYELKLPHLDQSISALLDDLRGRGLERSVLFLFCGEFGRTPLIRNQDPSGRPGRDHWAKAMSVFLSGGGFRMGQVVGATNAKAEEPIDRLMDSNCLLASIYQRFGIDTRASYLDHSGRPLPILPSGEPIRELFSA